MRHRSPRPFLDLVKQPSPRALRRGALAASAVVALGSATGVVLTSTEGSVSEGDVPHAQPAPSDAVTPTARISADRTDEPSRAASRTTPPATHRPRPQQPRPSASLPVPDVTHLPSVPASSVPPPARTTTDAPAPGPRRSPSRSTTPSPTPSEDRTVPQTTARTISLVNGVWTVAMGADEAATFECSVDGGAWKPCAPTDTLTLVSPGPHSLAVRATDTSGNTDPTPAQLTVKVTGADLGLD